MLLTRVMPCLLYSGTGLCKTVKFRNPSYVGDPINAIKIYNEKEVDELVFLDITATAEGREPDYKTISEIASECFMPLCYGGGVSRVEQVGRILEIGVEKVSMNRATIQNPDMIADAARAYGSQAIIASIDVRKNIWRRYEVVGERGSRSTGEHPVVFARRMADCGAGEILLTSVDREGTWDGYDVELIRQVTDAVRLPVIVNGGAGRLEHLQQAVRQGRASGLALGSMAVYQKKGMGVLINFPDRARLEELLS